jgi:predicted O-methyltransferase YrrM
MRRGAQCQELVTGPLSSRECDYLDRIVSELAPRRLLEVGHYNGLSSCVLIAAMPDSATLVTVDHHRGDDWCPATSPDRYQGLIDSVRDGKDVDVRVADMLSVDYVAAGPFDFVFYDSDHHREPVEAWWAAALPSFADRCTLTFDDADWDEQSCLIGLAELAGFRSVRTHDFVRYEHDKLASQTFTVEWMVRTPA